MISAAKLIAGKAKPTMAAASTTLCWTEPPGEDVGLVDFMPAASLTRSSPALILVKIVRQA